MWAGSGGNWGDGKILKRLINSSAVICVLLLEPPTEFACLEGLYRGEEGASHGAEMRTGFAARHPWVLVLAASLTTWVTWGR